MGGGTRLSWNSREVGIRVGAVLKSDKETAWLLGYGAYEGDHPRDDLQLETETREWWNVTREQREQMVRDMFAANPPEKLTTTLEEALTREMSEEAREAFVQQVLRNPRIRLDDGRVVWGYQMWWGPEEQVRRSIAGRKVIVCDLDGNPIKQEE
jgi:hypothetical protein